MRYFINENQDKIITMDDDGVIDIFEELNDEEAEEEDIQPKKERKSKGGAESKTSKIKELLKQGMPIKKIAEKLECSEPLIYGIKKKMSPIDDTSKVEQSLIHEYGRTTVAEVKSLYLQGEPIIDISMELNITVMSVEEIINGLNIKR